MVRAGGVEPPRAYTHCHLKTARLPFRHARRQSISLHPDCEVNKSACRGLWSNVLALVDVLWSLGVRGVQPAGEADARPGGLRARPWDVRRACAGLRRERGRETASVCGWPPLGISEADFGQAASMCAWDGPIRAVSRRSCGKVSACVEWSRQQYRHHHRDPGCPHVLGVVHKPAEMTLLWQLWLKGGMKSRQKGLKYTP